MARAVSFSGIRAAQATALANVICNGGAGPVRVQQINLTFAHNEDREQEKASLMWLASLLLQLPRLRYLDMHVHRLIWVPPLLQIRHLSLTFASAVSSSLQWLSLLANLQTLLLRMRHPQAESTCMGTLDLQSLVQLHSACLCDVRCKELHIAPRCNIHLELRNVDQFALSSWSSTLAFVRSMAWGSFGHLPVGIQPPPSLLHACNLSRLDLHCAITGSASAPLTLGDVLPAIKKLRIKSSAVHLCLPARSVLEELVIFADEINLSCEDVGAVLEHLRAFHFVYRSARGPFLIDLSMAILAQGKAVNTKGCPWERTELRHRVADCDFRCPCGCCGECLRRLVLVHA